MLRKRYSDPIIVRRAKDAVNLMLRRAKRVWPRGPLERDQPIESLKPTAERRHPIQQQLAALIKTEKTNIQSQPVDLYVLTTIHPRVTDFGSSASQLLKKATGKNARIPGYRNVKQNWFVCHAFEEAIDTDRGSALEYYSIDRLITSDKLDWEEVPKTSAFHVQPSDIIKQFMFDDEAKAIDVARMLTSLTKSLPLVDGILRTQEKLLGAIFDDDETLANNLVNEYQTMVAEIAPSVKKFVLKMKLLTD